MIKLSRFICLIALVLPAFGAHSRERLPDGGIAEGKGGGVVRAWYARPTDRYSHGVLGDAIEGGSLVAVDETGRQFELVLPLSQVFEDIAPRIVDLDGDGRNEVITIRTDLEMGAAVAVYEITDGKIVQRAATAPIGRANRWLSIAGIADFRGDGSRQIAIVKTPHVGGVLEVLALRGAKLVSLYPPKRGYSTHFIGSRILSLAGVGDLNGDGAAELVLPDQARRRVIVLRFGETITESLGRDLPARVSGAVKISGARILVPLESGGTVTFDIPRDALPTL